MEHAVSSELGARFAIERTIGHGAMGEVYRGRDLVTGRPLAVKVLRGQGERARFMREAQVLATLTHPNIVRYVAHGVSRAGESWLAMEWLEGQDLYQRLGRGPLPLVEAVVLAKVLSRVLAWLHGRGLVHRDLKPSNVFLVDNQVARATVLDFGVARFYSAADPTLTPTGTLMGTPEYMAPEQVNDAKRVDARADVFALGCILYQTLTGRSPFKGPSLFDIIHKVLYEEPHPLAALRPDTPDALLRLVAWMMAKSPKDRPADGAAVAQWVDRLDAPTDSAGGAGFAESITTIRVESDTVVSPAPPSSRSSSSAPRSRPSRPSSNPPSSGPPRSNPPQSAPPPGSMTRILDVDRRRRR